MPANKSALLRYRIIDACLTSKQRKYPSMDFIIKKVETEVPTTLSNSMFTKDLENMRKIYSAPIKYSREHQGYYYTQPEFSIKEFPLSHDEIEALDFSTALLQQLKNTPMFHHFETAINRVIDGYRISKHIGKSETQLLQVEEPLSTGGNEWLEVILKGITHKNCLDVLYHAFGRAEKTHVFSPYLIKEYRNRWYAVGFSETAKNILVLALDRIKSITKCKNKYVPEGNFVPAQFFKYSFGITQIHDATVETVELLFTPAQSPYVISQPLHLSQQVISNDENGLHIRLTVYLTQELVMCILSYGPNVKVLGPELLVTQISERIEEMKALY